MSAIAVGGVDVRLGGSQILHDIDLTVETGQFVGLVGPNGAGKTTLLRTVNGRLRPVTGTVRLTDDRVADLDARAIGRRVATVPQNTEVSFDFAVRDIVEMGRHPHRARLGFGDPDATRVDWALERTETAELSQRSITAVSGGERQRVLVARALAQDTPVLLLDEPTASLDVNHQVRTLDLVRGLVDDEEKTVVAAIHDLDLAARFCDELVLLAGGRVRSIGEPETVLTESNLRGAFETAAAIGRNPVTGTPTVTALTERSTRSACRVHVIPGGANDARLLSRLDQAGFEVSVGVVHEGTQAFEAVRGLDLEHVAVPPFTTIEEEDVAEAADLVRQAAATVVADIEVGPANQANLDLAAIGDPVVLVEEGPFQERNRAGPPTQKRYDRLREHGRGVTLEEVVPAIRSALTERPPQNQSPRPG